MMRKTTSSIRSWACVLTALMLLSFSAMLSAQIVENPAKPKAANAGRVVTPTEVLSISDEGRSDYYFKYPQQLATAPDGSLFVIDENQLLWFGPDGAFERNLFKKGQGPGEMASAGACLFCGRPRHRPGQISLQAPLVRCRRPV